MRASVAPARATGSSAGMSVGRHRPRQVLRLAEMTAGAVTQVRQRRAQLRRRPTDPDIFPVGSMAFEQFKRHEELTARGMEGKCLEQPGNGMGAARRDG